MNGRERFKAALEGKQPDIIPMIPGNNNAFLCHFYDVTVYQLLEAPANPMTNRPTAIFNTNEPIR